MARTGFEGQREDMEANTRNASDQKKIEPDYEIGHEDPMMRVNSC